MDVGIVNRTEKQYMKSTQKDIIQDLEYATACERCFKEHGSKCVALPRSCFCNTTSHKVDPIEIEFHHKVFSDTKEQKCRHLIRATLSIIDPEAKAVITIKTCVVCRKEKIVKAVLISDLLKRIGLLIDMKTAILNEKQKKNESTEKPITEILELQRQFKRFLSIQLYGKLTE